LVDIGLRRRQGLRAGIGRQAGAIGAEQFVDRLIRDQLGNVPQRDVAGADGAHAGRARLAPQPLVEPLAVERVLADQHRLQILNEARPVTVGGPVHRAEKSVALHPFVGDDFQKAELARPGLVDDVRPVGQRGNAVPAEQGEGDIGDSHGAIKATARRIVQLRFVFRFPHVRSDRATPTKVGVHRAAALWIPAFAGMAAVTVVANRKTINRIRSLRRTRGLFTREGGGQTMRLALRIFLVVLFGAAYWQAMRGRGFDLAADYETILKDVVGTGFWLAAASFCTELLRMFIMRQARRQGFASRMPRLLFDIGGIVIFFCAGLVIVSQVFGLELSGLLFTSGIIAAAAGFALQPTATDLIAGISLNFREGTIKIGDWVQVANGVVGKVTQITWSDTHLVTLDDRMIVVRNSKLVEIQLMNYSAPQRPYQNKLKITVGFEAPPDRVSAILVTAMKAVPNLVPNPEPYVIIEEFSENGVPYSMYFHVPDYPEAQFITNQVAVNALKFLDQAGFAPAYPKRENYDGREARTQRGIERRMDI